MLPGGKITVDVDRAVAREVFQKMEESVRRSEELFGAGWRTPGTDANTFVYATIGGILSSNRLGVDAKKFAPDPSVYIQLYDALAAAEKDGKGSVQIALAETAASAIARK